MKLYDLVKTVLATNPDTRNDDKLLVWATWNSLGYVGGGMLLREDFMKHNVPSSDSITRAGRKVREDHPGLRPSNYVRRLRKKKQDTKGMFIYHERVKENGPRFTFDSITGKYKQNW